MLTVSQRPPLQRSSAAFERSLRVCLRAPSACLLRPTGPERLSRPLHKFVSMDFFTHFLFTLTAQSRRAPPRIRICFRFPPTGKFFPGHRRTVLAQTMFCSSSSHCTKSAFKHFWLQFIGVQIKVVGLNTEFTTFRRTCQRGKGQVHFHV